jgi:hypothetical protein
LSSDSDSDSSSKSSESSALSSPLLLEEDEEDQLLNKDGLTLEDLPNLMEQGWDWANEDKEDFLMGYSHNEDEDEGDDNMDMEEVGGEDIDSEDVWTGNHHWPSKCTALLMLSMHSNTNNPALVSCIRHHPLNMS